VSQLDGKVALITGAALGIGAATARALGRRGCRLVLTDVDGEPLRALAAEIGEDRVVVWVCDVRDLGSMQEAVAAGVERFGGIDLVVANGGIASYGSVMAVDPVAFRRVLEVNACAAAFVKGLEGRRRRIYVPRWVGAIAALRSVVVSRLGDREPLKHVPDLLPLMDAEVARLGRSTSARNVGLGDVVQDELRSSRTLSG
jgi:NAD(P)-dependent dehydrogenase (short-subunit alcohol dehydrogenase family)